MKAFIVDRYGSTDDMRAGDMPDPQLREDDVLVQIHATSVNPLDLGLRDGVFKRILPYRLPLIVAMTWQGSWFGSGLVCGDLRSATRSMHDPIKIGSVRSRSSFR